MPIQRFITVELTSEWMGHSPGTLHCLGERYAKALINRGAAKEKIEAKMVSEEEVQNKMVSSAPKNKRQKRG